MPDAKPQPAAPSLHERMLQNIKSAHDIITGLTASEKEAAEKLSAAKADTDAAAPIADQIIEKLSTVHVDGELLFEPYMRDQYRAAMNSKEGMADLMNQVVDVLQSSSGNASKTASALGEAAADPNPYGNERSGPVTSFGQLPSRIRM